MRGGNRGWDVGVGVNVVDGVVVDDREVGGREGLWDGFGELWLGLN